MAKSQLTITVKDLDSVKHLIKNMKAEIDRYRGALESVLEETHEPFIALIARKALFPEEYKNDDHEVKG